MIQSVVSIFANSTMMITHRDSENAATETAEVAVVSEASKDDDDEKDSGSCFLIESGLGVGMKKDAKLEMQKKIKKCEDADDTWTWLNDLPIEEYPLLMDLHKSTRKKWNSLSDWYSRPADGNKSDSGKAMMKRLGKRKMLKDCLFWLVLYWANSANYNLWTTESVCRKKAYKQLKCFVQNRREGKGGQGIKKLQQKFWERKYPNLFDV